MEGGLMKAVLEKKPRAGRDYLELVCEFPLRLIRSKKDHAEALRVYGRFAGREDLSAGENDYVDALVHFMEDYEARHERSKMLAMTPLEALQHLMELNERNTVDLGVAVGSRGLASEILNGKRGISRQVARKLAERFAVKAELFLRVDER
jgi:HTH-type transcriptional regulator / antitoxin HigA